jgi:hypothetical protein
VPEQFVLRGEIFATHAARVGLCRLRHELEQWGRFHSIKFVALCKMDWKRDEAQVHAA